MNYLVLIEKGEHSYGASVPDVPGCFAIGNSLSHVQERIKEALEFHLECLKKDGDPIPEPAYTRANVTLSEVSVDIEHLKQLKQPA